MGKVPRHEFVPADARPFAYADHPLLIGHGQTISQPFIVAFMTEKLDPKPTDHVLEIGTGSGYQAAVLARLGARVTTIERLPDLAEGARAKLRDLGIQDVDVRLGDGSIGEAEGAPWDGIVVTAAAPSIPDPLREQLAVGARLVIPVGPRYQQDLIVVERRGPNDWQEWSDGAVVFVPLVGEGGWREGEPP
jgi:protein-L-isoaspartate(D-aspartate) O-methyltransferase